MTSQNTLDILKQAILLEKRGNAFYATIAAQAKDPGVKEFFAIMADEEAIHAKFLGDQFAEVSKGRHFQKTAMPSAASGKFTDKVLSEEMSKKISAAGAEAAAISAAIEMEKRSIELYSSQSVSSADPAEKELYLWLAEWEKTHLKLLSDLDNELKEKIWFDNQFWPF
jgi:rubrerythrin